jgi:hypothetical protein
MYTLKLLAPIVGSLCFSNFVEGQGELCNARQISPPVIKYYEPGKSCYIEGVFYESCSKRN